MVVEDEKKAADMKLSVIVPVYNEADTVQQLLKTLLQQPVVKEVVVVDDASDDGTDKILGQIKSKKIKTIRHERNQGKGAAIKTGLEQVSGTHILIQDADLEYDPRDIPLLTKPVKEEKANVVYGSRFTGPRRNMFFWHMVGNRLLSLTVNILYNTTLSDMETCYKLLPTTLMKDLAIESNDFRIEPEITCKVLSRGEFIFEVPISYTGRTFAEGKKITWQDGFWAFITILKWRFSV